MGDRAKNISDAISCLDMKLGRPFKAMSSVIETEPWGFETESRFLNAVVLYELEFGDGYNAQAEGLMILETCKEIESMLGRVGKHEYDGEGRGYILQGPLT